MDISEALKKEIEKDIKRCNSHSEVKGSESLISGILWKITGGEVLGQFNHTLHYTLRKLKKR